MAYQVAKILRALFCLMVLISSCSAFAHTCGRYLYSGPELTTEEIVSFILRKIFKDDSQDFAEVDAYLAKFLAQRAQKLSPRLRDEYLTKIEWVNWVDHIRKSNRVIRSMVGLHDPKTNETSLVNALKGTIHARLTLVHEFIHLEQYLTRTRTLLRALTYDNVLKEESEAQAAEHDFLTGLILEYPELKQRLLEDETLDSFWMCSKGAYICEGIRIYKKLNAKHNQSLLMKYGLGYVAGATCSWAALWALF